MFFSLCPYFQYMSEATRDRDHFAVYLQSEWGISMCLSNYISFVISRFTLVVPQFGRTLHKEAWQPTDRKLLVSQNCYY